MSRFTFLLIAVVLSSLLSTPSQAQYDGSSSSRIDASTRWTFRTISPVTIGTPIVRLSDVIQPVNPNLAAWQRLAQSPIGLVPISGETMTIQRARLNKAILSVEATPRAIDWLGPEEIRVVYRKGAGKPQPTIAQTSYHESVSSSHQAGEPREKLTSSAAKRVVHWIELGLKQFQEPVVESYAIEVDSGQAGLVPLRWISGITNVESLSPIEEGRCRFQITARSATGTVESEVEVLLAAHPTVIVPTHSLGRGKQISISDLERKPVPADQVDPIAVDDVDLLVGQEVRSPLRAGVPILPSDVGPPIIIHRGDLIEVRVTGGGVNVSTNAKALSDGAVSQLIEIETLNPRKRLVARVADSGTVEIITRAPKVR